jgi:hypothetical protein
LFDIQVVVDVELRGKPDFCVANPLGDIVFGQFEGDAFEVLGVLHDGASEGEPGQILGQIPVVIFENETAKSVFGGGGEFDAPAFGEFDQGWDPQRAIEVQVEVGFGNPAKKGFRNHGGNVALESRVCRIGDVIGRRWDFWTQPSLKD